MTQPRFLSKKSDGFDLYRVDREFHPIEKRFVDANDPAIASALAADGSRGVFPNERIAFMETEQIHSVLRQPTFDPQGGLLISKEFQSAAITSPAQETPFQIVFGRSSSDNIECTVTTPRAGFLRIIELWGPGWSVTVDGRPAQVVLAMDALLAVAVPSGKHEVRFSYQTHGKWGGLVISLLSLAGLGLWMRLEGKIASRKAL